MTLTEFAERFRVKTKLDSCGEQIIPGKPYKTHRPDDRNQIFDHGDDEHVGVSLLLTTARQWVMGDNHTSRATTIRIPDQRQ